MQKTRYTSRERIAVIAAVCVAVIAIAAMAMMRTSQQTVVTQPQPAKVVKAARAAKTDTLKKTATKKRIKKAKAPAKPLNEGPRNMFLSPDDEPIDE